MALPFKPWNLVLLVSTILPIALCMVYTTLLIRQVPVPLSQHVAVMRLLAGLMIWTIPESMGLVLNWLIPSALLVGLLITAPVLRLVPCASLRMTILKLMMNPSVLLLTLIPFIVVICMVPVAFTLQMETAVWSMRLLQVCL